MVFSATGKILSGIILALVLALAGAGWLLKVSWEGKAVAESQRGAFEAALKAQNEEISRYEADLMAREKARQRSAREAAEWRRKWKEDQKDEAVKAWDGAPHPPVVTDRLRDLRSGSSRETDQDPHSTRNTNP